MTLRAPASVAALLCLASLTAGAQSAVTAQVVSRAERPLLGRQVMIAGRVLVGTGVLDSARVSVFVEDSSGSVLVEGRPELGVIPLVPGDSVWATGVIDRGAGVGFLDEAVVTRVGTGAPPIPAPLAALAPAQLEALASRLVVIEGVVVSRNVGRGDAALTIGDTTSEGNYVRLVEDLDGNAALGFERFSIGDRVRVTGVLVSRTGRRSGITRYTIFPRGADDIAPLQLTARARRSIALVAGIALLASALAVLLVRHHRQAKRDRLRAFAARDDLARGYQALLERAPIGIVVHDQERFVYANAAFVSLVGASSAAELEAARFSDFVHIDTGELNAASAAGRTAGQGSLPLRLLRRDGSSLDVEVAESSIEYAGRSCAQLVVHDVSDRVRAQKAVAESEVRLRQSQKLEAVGLLAGGVAHDFNNILTIVKGNVALMLDGCPACHAVADEAREIDQAADRGAALTSQLLAFSRKQVIKPTTLELDSVVHNMERMLRRLVPESVEQRIALNSPRSFVLADAGQLEQVIVNLVVNARDAMSVGGVLAIRTTNVHVDAAASARSPDLQDMEPGNYVCLSVSDTGVGMEEETRQRAFEPFFTTKDAGKGTGLGLATVYGIAKQNNGYVFIHSLKGMGTTVRVYLPRADAVARESIGALVPDKPQPAADTILLVEDEPTIRKLAARVLRRSGYAVLEAENGMEAISILQKHDGLVELLLTDVIMPGLSGPEIASHLCRERPGMRVLFISGYTDDHLAEHGVLASNVELLQKPFAPEQLLQRVKKVLSVRTPAAV